MAVKMASNFWAVLGWKPKYSIQQGLGETMDWYTRFFSTKKKAQKR